MIIYLRAMRQKDELKQDALINATVKLVNQIGFVASSVSKIAKEAGVSPATIYIYYKNKEDLLVSTYVIIKQKMGKSIVANLDFDEPIRDIFEKVWFNMFDYVSLNMDYFHFAEQFSNSPYADLVNKEELEEPFLPVIEVLQRGIEQKIIKDVHFDILASFMFYPIFNLANKRMCANFEKNRKNIETAFSLAWDAIKL